MSTGLGLPAILLFSRGAMRLYAPYRRGSSNKDLDIDRMLENQENPKP